MSDTPRNGADAVREWFQQAFTGHAGGFPGWIRRHGHSEAADDLLRFLGTRGVRLVSAGEREPPFEDAVCLEYPSGNWAGFMDAALAEVLVPYWNTGKADDNQILTVEPIRGHLRAGERDERALLDEMRVAAQAAYDHLDRFGIVSGGRPEEHQSQARVFDLLRPALAHAADRAALAARPSGPEP
jgi:hypothetical protein